MKIFQRLKVLLLVFVLVFVSACNMGEIGGGGSNGSNDGTVHVHTIFKRAGQNATCTKEGRKEYWYCIACSEKFFDSEGKQKILLEELLVIPATGHAISFVAEKEPTEFSVGTKAHYECGQCKKYFWDENGATETSKGMTVIPTLTHKHITEFKQGSTAIATTQGIRAHWYCGGCEKYFKDSAGEEEIMEAETIIEAPFSLVDFVVEVEENRDPIVLQLTDTQIIDSAQRRYPGRLGGSEIPYWATDRMEECCFDYLTEVITQVKPDLIILTGDNVYGEFDDNGTVYTRFVEFMESFNIPWSPVFGNHDNESKMGVDWQCRLLEEAKNCLFKQNNLTGNGNYSVGIAQGGLLKRVFYMLDSGGCSREVGFGADQIAWYSESGAKVNAHSPNTKISFAFHVQLNVFADAFEKYGYPNNLPINLDRLSTKDENDFGHIGRKLKGGWDEDYAVWNSMKAVGVDSIFVGHEHCNSASVVYEGVRLQYGQKSSEYDRYVRINESTGEFSNDGIWVTTLTPLIGGTVMKLSKESAEIIESYIYFCQNAGGKVDWSKWKK